MFLMSCRLHISSAFNRLNLKTISLDIMSNDLTLDYRLSRAKSNISLFAKMRQNCSDPGLIWESRGENRRGQANFTAVRKCKVCPAATELADINDDRSNVLPPIPKHGFCQTSLNLKFGGPEL